MVDCSPKLSAISNQIYKILSAAAVMSSMSNLISKPLLGTLLDGRYKVINLLETTLNPKIYLAEDTQSVDFDKCLIKELTLPESYLKNWSEAGEILSQFSEILRLLSLHEQIPNFYTCFYEKTSFFWVEEWIEGTPLSEELLAGLPWQETQVQGMLQEVGSVLQYAHSLGLLHGNLTPEKIIRRAEDGKLIVTGFGMAKDCWQPPHPPQTKQQKIAFLEAIFTQNSPTKNPYLPFSIDSLYQLSPQTDFYALALMGMRAQTGITEEQLLFYYDNHIWQQMWSELADNPQIKQAEIEENLPITSGVLEEKLEAEVGESLVTENYESTPIEEPVPITPTVPESALKSTPKPQQSTATQWTMRLGLALGLGANAAALAFGMYNLLVAKPIDPGLDTFARATQEYNSGSLKNAIQIANSVPSYSAAYHQAKDAATEWQNTLNLAEEQFAKVEKAYQQKRWRDVLTEANKLPALASWHQKVEPMVQKATVALAPEIDKWVKLSAQRAKAKDFKGAIQALEQIPKGLPNYEKFQAKIDEYSQKQHIKNEVLGNKFLQQASQRAEVKDYDGALNILNKIPKYTKAYTIAQGRKVDYGKRLRAQNKSSSGVGAIPAVPRAGNPRAMNADLQLVSWGLNPGELLQEINTEFV